jgi:DNA-binding response OmpR family regulator
VLCIDDDPEISGILQMRLRQHRIGVIRAFSGMQGCWLALQSQPQAIITDLAMPQGTGDYVLRTLKENPRTAHIPVIIFTGRGDEALHRRMQDAGAAAVLSKPVSFQQIQNVLSRYIEF